MADRARRNHIGRFREARRSARRGGSVPLGPRRRGRSTRRRRSQRPARRRPGAGPAFVIHALADGHAAQRRCPRVRVALQHRRRPGRQAHGVQAVAARCEPR